MKNFWACFFGLFSVPALLSVNDRREYLTQRVMSMIVFTIAVFLMVVLVIIAIRGVKEIYPVLILSTLLVFAVLGWRFSMGKAWRVSRWLAILMCWLLGVYGSTGETGGMAYLYYALAFMLAGLIVGPREMIVMMLLSLATHFGLRYDRAPDQYLELLPHFVTVSAAYTGIVLVVWLSVKLMDQALRQSTHDPLTGLYNRGYFDSEMARLENRRSEVATIIVMDINDLKTVNDQYGHAAGDQLIVRLAQALRLTFRNNDRLCRIGGDEFVAILLNTAGDIVAALIENLEAMTAAENAYHDGPPLSIAIGSASGRPGCSMQDLFILADTRMYEDKDNRKRAALISLL